MKRYALALFILLFVPSITIAQNDVDLMWKARAIKAIENYDTIKAEYMKKNSSELRLKLILESAYALIIAEPGIAIKKTSAIVAYHLVLNYGDDGFLDIAYTYDSRTQEFLGVRVDRLPRNRAVMLLNRPDKSDLFAIANINDQKEPAIIFSKSRPFDAVVIDK